MLQLKKLAAILLFLCALCTAFLLENCQTAQQAVSFDPEKVPYTKLSEYAFFQGNLRQLIPNEGVLEYEPITTLFTDYAHKARFVWMPDSVQAHAQANGSLAFPDNSVLIKHFYYPADFREPDQAQDRVETRLMFKRQGKWEAFSYVWNDTETDAELNLVGDFKQVSWVDLQGQPQQIEYMVPNKNQCKSCHNVKNNLLPIGPKVQYLNSELAYLDGSRANQLQRWVADGKLADADLLRSIAPIADWDNPASGSVAERAQAYLEVNCGHCHSPNGPAHTTGLYLHTQETDLRHWGLCKNPVAAGKGSGDRQFGIAPGNPDASILVYRMESNDPGIMMPEIGRAIPHEEGLELVRSWIEEMEGACETTSFSVKSEI